jgi:UDP-N-acetylenolpyruvoylglucosamine reductase
MLVIGADLVFPLQEKAISEMKIKERIDFCQQNQDCSASNFGSVFSAYDSRVLACFRRLHAGSARGVQFSPKKANWLLNHGNGSYAQALRLINLCIGIHRLLHKKIDTEVRIWK